MSQHTDPNDVGRMPPEDRPVHAGPHHHAPCGEWRPAAGNTGCAYCPERCPACGTVRLNRRRPGGEE